MKAENRDVEVAEDDALPSVETTVRFPARRDRFA